MKRIAIAGLAAVLASTTSYAADLMIPEPEPFAPPPPVFDWTGFHLGAHGGYAFDHGRVRTRGELIYDWRRGGTNTSADRGPAVASDVDRSGRLSDRAFGGVHAGYSVQQDRIVYGVEADVNFASNRTTQGAVSLEAAKDPEEDPLTFADIETRTKLGWHSTVRGSVGVDFGRLLLFGTGGLAFGKASATGRVTSTIVDDDGELVAEESARFGKSSTEFGYAVGGGGKYAVTDNLIVGITYLYVDLGETSRGTAVARRDFGPPPPTGPFFDQATGSGSIKSDHSFHTVRVGLSYKF